MEEKYSSEIQTDEFGMEEIMSEINSSRSTAEIVSILDRVMRKNMYTLNTLQMRDSLLKASSVAKTFDDYRILYLFSFFSVYPKIWPDFKWVDSLMENSINYCKNEKQSMVLFKDATLMGRNLITSKIKLQNDKKLVRNMS